MSQPIMITSREDGKTLKQLQGENSCQPLLGVNDKCKRSVFCSHICEAAYMPLAITWRVLVKKIKYDYKDGSKYDELSWPLWAKEYRFEIA